MQIKHDLISEILSIDYQYTALKEKLAELRQQAISFKESNRLEHLIVSGIDGKNSFDIQAIRNNVCN